MSALLKTAFYPEKFYTPTMQVAEIKEAVRFSRTASHYNIFLYGEIRI